MRLLLFFSAPTSRIRNRRRATGLATACATSLLLAAPADADHNVTPLTEMLAGSSSIVIGTVTSLATSPASGDLVIGGTVQEVLAGTTSTGFSVTWPADAEDSPGDVAPLNLGDEVLVLLRSGSSGSEAGSQGERLMKLISENRAAAREIILRATDIDGNKSTAARSRMPIIPWCPDCFKLANFADLLEAKTRLNQTGGTLCPVCTLPRPLLGSLLAELEAGTDAGDAALVEAIGCSTSDAYVLDAKLLAIRLAGSLALAAMAPCLESYARDATRPDLAIEAIGALGEIGSPSSGAVLLGLLPRAARDPKLKPADAKSDALTNAAQAEDPEDEADPIADSSENQTPGQDDDAPAQNSEASDDETDAETTPGTDALRRRNDSGRVLAAALALGKLGSSSAIDPVAVLLATAKEGDDLALHSTIVHSLGLIGNARARKALTVLSKSHPNPLIRTQALETLASPTP